MFCINRTTRYEAIEWPIASPRTVRQCRRRSWPCKLRACLNCVHRAVNTLSVIVVAISCHSVSAMWTPATRDAETRTGTTGVVIPPAKSSWTRASARVVPLLAAAVVASLAGAARSSAGDSATAVKLPVYVDDRVAERTASPPSAAGPAAADERNALEGRTSLSRHLVGVNRRKSTVPTADIFQFSARTVHTILCSYISII